MVKSELIRALSEKLPALQLKDVDLSVNCIIQHMEEALSQGKRIEVRGFGNFTVRHRPPRTARNPKTSALVELPAKSSIHFKPGKEMRDLVNAYRGKYRITE